MTFNKSLFIMIAPLFLALSSCVELPNLNPDAPGSTMFVLDLGAPVEDISNGLDLNGDNDPDILFGIVETNITLGIEYKYFMEMVNGSFMAVFDASAPSLPKLKAISAGQLVGGAILNSSFQDRGWYLREQISVALQYEGLCLADVCPVISNGNIGFSGYVAFNFILPDGVHYGWLELTQSYSCPFGPCVGSTIIEKLAYNTVAGRAVRVGEI